MLFKTEGIVFNSIKYGDSSIIVKIYTQAFGLKSYIVNSVRSKKSKGKASLYRPLSILELVVYENPNKSINRISEAKNAYPLLNISDDIRKTSIALFLSEVFYKSLKKEDDNNEVIFNFLKNAIIELEETNENFETLHLYVLAGLLNHLGFLPSSANQMNDLINENYPAEDKNLLEEKNYSSLKDLFAGNSISISKTNRNQLLSTLLSYYRSMIDDFGKIKSLDVLKIVFS